MKKTLLLLLLSLFFTGCIERGQTLKPAPIHTTPTVTKAILSNPSVVKSKKSITSPLVKTVPVVNIKPSIKEEKKITEKITMTQKTVKQPDTTNTDDFFGLSEDTKNKISGFFIIIIGIIVLL